jgi:hypothetical protein
MSADELAEKRKAYRVLQESWRCALIMTPSIEGVLLKVSLLMLQSSSKDRFYSTGELISWHGRDSYAKALGVHWRGVTRAWATLEQESVIRLLVRGRHHSAPHYAFNNNWLSNTSTLLDLSGCAASFRGQIPFITLGPPEEPGMTAKSPLSPGTSSLSPDSGVTSVSSGVTPVSFRGDKALSPYPLDLPPGFKPPSVSKIPPRPNGRGVDCFPTREDFSEYELQWAELVIARDKRRTYTSCRRVLDSFAAEYGDLDSAIDKVLGNQVTGDPIAGLRKILQCTDY